MALTGSTLDNAIGNISLAQAFSPAADGSMCCAAGFEGQVYGAENNAETPIVKGPDINGPTL